MTTEETLERTAWRLVAPAFKKCRDLCVTMHFKAGSTIVKDGVFQAGPNLRQYNAVPLAYVESGILSIVENGRAVKYYSKGECLGLFETACFLEEGLSGRIGRWHVRAATDVTLRVATEVFLNSLSTGAKQALAVAARSNPIAKPLSKLPLLDWFAVTYGLTPQTDVVIAYNSHILPSSLEFIKHLAYVAGPENTFVLEKPYSTIAESLSKVAEGGVRTFRLKVDPQMSYEYAVRRNVDHFWREIVEHVHTHGIKKVIVISDGGDVLLSPVLRELHDVEIVGIEQTEHGLRRLKAARIVCPVISVADSPAKKQLESPFIAEAALAKMTSLGLLDNRLGFGVLGAGSIGLEIIRGLNLRGIMPLVYDPIDTPLPLGQQAQSLEKLVQNSDIIIGTTGSDSLRGMYIERLRGQKTFVSTSSSNIEFAYLFNLAGTYASTFEDSTLPISKHCTAVILNGGYPINFDRTREWESLRDIQLTRTLLYAGVFEALNLFAPAAGIRRLKPGVEKAIVAKWLEYSKPG